MADQTTTTTLPDWLQSYWKNQYLDPMMQATANPLPVYGGPTVAPWNANQNTAADMQRQFATNGTAYSNAAGDAVARQAAGTSNPYAGDNPNLQSVIDKSNADIAKAYATGTAAQTDAAAARAGSYGGTGYQEQVGMNQDMLGRNLAANTSNLRYQNYQNSGNLWGQDQARQVQAASLSPALQAADTSAIKGLFDMGTNQQGTTQANFDAMKNYFTQSVQAPLTTLDLRGNAIGRASGNQSVQTVNGPGASNLNWLAALPIFAGLFGR